LTVDVLVTGAENVLAIVSIADLAIPMIIGPNDSILAGRTDGCLSWLAYWRHARFVQWQDAGHVFGLLVLFCIGVASPFAEIWLGV
jgi:hypothetical protein